VLKRLPQLRQLKWKLLRQLLFSQRLLPKLPYSYAQA
jgi:hypothetical protein